MSEHDNGYDPYNSATTRKAPPVPEWLRNDPELEAAARVMVERWRDMHPSIIGLWSRCPLPWDTERYRK